MSEAIIKHMHEDMEIIKRDLAVIKHILAEEKNLTPEALKRLEKARKTPLSQYVKL